jgi:nitrate reductase cytochrome c-type subunit
MADSTTDRNHCYECGSEEIRYRSLYPLEPHFIERNGDGTIKSARGFNSEYNVCAKCYVGQYERRYPDVEVPGKAVAAAGGE